MLRTIHNVGITVDTVLAVRFALTTEVLFPKFGVTLHAFFLASVILVSRHDAGRGCYTGGMRKGRISVSSTTYAMNEVERQEEGRCHHQSVRGRSFLNVSKRSHGHKIHEIRSFLAYKRNSQSPTLPGTALKISSRARSPAMIPQLRKQVALCHREKQ